MPPPQATSFADDLERIRRRSTTPTAPDFGADLEKVRQVRPTISDTPQVGGAAQQVAQLAIRQLAQAHGSPIETAAKLFWESPQGQMLIGAGKGAAHTFSTLGSLVHKIPGVSASVDAVYGSPGASASAFRGMDEITKPVGGFQRAGNMAEQVVEAIAPGSRITKTGVTLASKVPAVVRPLVRGAVEAFGSAGIAAAQGSDPKTAALVGGAMGTAIPAVQSAMASHAPKVQASAIKNVEQALGATKERFKAMSAKIAPEMLRRGLRGSRAGLKEMAQTATEEIGPKIDEAIEQFGDRVVSTRLVTDALETSKDAFRHVETMTLDDAIARGFAVRLPSKTVATGILDASGQPITKSVDGGLQFTKGVSRDVDGTIEKITEFEPRAIAQIAKLQAIIADLGESARADQLVAVRRAWDKVVAQAGGFAQRAPGAIGMPLRDASEAAAKREATTAIRRVLDDAVPELTKLNKEFSFWKNLDDVLTQTMQRTTPQGRGLGSRVAEVGGAVVGSAAGAGGMGAFITGKLAKAVDAAFTSTRWKLVSAQMKDKIAGLMASGKWQEAALQVQRAVGTQGSKVLTPAGVTSGGR